MAPQVLCTIWSKKSYHHHITFLPQSFATVWDNWINAAKAIHLSIIFITSYLSYVSTVRTGEALTVNCTRHPGSRSHSSVAALDTNLHGCYTTTLQPSVPLQSVISAFFSLDPATSTKFWSVSSISEEVNPRGLQISISLSLFSEYMDSAEDSRGILPSKW